MKLKNQIKSQTKKWNETKKSNKKIKTKLRNKIKKWNEE